MNREASARRPWPRGAPPSFPASLHHRGKAAPLLRFQRNKTVNYLREAGERARPRPHPYSRPRGDGCDITAMNASVGILKRCFPPKLRTDGCFFFVFFLREPPNNQSKGLFLRIFPDVTAVVSVRAMKITLSRSPHS